MMGALFYRRIWGGANIHNERALKFCLPWVILKITSGPGFNLLLDQLFY